VGGVVVNLARPRDLDDADLAAALDRTLDPDVVTADLKAAGLRVGKTLVSGLLTEAHDHAVRRALEDSQRALVSGFDVPTYELPRLAGGADLGGLYEFAARLREQGMA
jgi:hypothetical protein